MKKRILFYIFSIIYAVIFLITVPEGYKQAVIYPFDRLLVGSTFVYRLHDTPHALFHAKLKTCDSKTLKNDSQTLTEWECISTINNVTVKQHFNSNTKIALWLVLLLAFSSILLIAWALGIYYARKDMFADLFIFIANAVALNCLVYIDLFFVHRLHAVYPAFSCLVPLCLFYIVFMMKESNELVKTLCYMIVMLTGLVLSGTVYWKVLPFEKVYQLNGIITIVLFITAATMLLSERNHHARFLIKRNIVVAGAIIAGGVLPFSVLLTGMYHDIQPSTLFSLLFTIAIPVSIGNGLLANYSLGSLANLQKNSISMVVDIIIAVVISTGLFYIYNFYSILLSPLIIIGLFLAIMLIILHIRMLIIRALDDIIFLKNDEYSLSLQRIAEIITWPKNLKEKLDAIESELKTLIKVKKISYAIIDDYQYNDERIIVLNEDSNLVTFFKKRNETITWASFFSSKNDEKAVEEYILTHGIEACIPVFINESLQGILFVHNKGDYFTNLELNFLSMLALQVHQLVINSKALTEYINSRNYEKELDLASYIQVRLFPKKPPQDCGIQFSIYSRPYLKVTGDYYDIIPVDKNRVAVVIADISGHGLSAAMILSATSAIINGMLKEKKGIDKVVAELNHFLTIRYTGFELITLFIGLYNKRTRSMEYINAGHIAPLVISKDKKIYHLEGRSKILGVDPMAQYYPSRYAFGSGDQMILYTDGLTDLYNSNSDITFGEESLNRILTQLLTKSIEEKIHAITEGIVTFGQEYIKDDITIIGMHFN
ncbi:MAG: GAF domain-containing SpoIIE family protein phosphatase [Spirochaetota bacterium]|jgi:sigma-B regulation protein RsbU (phosphoserine phosphatase)